MNECYGVNRKISRGLLYIMWSEKASQRSQYVKVKRNESYNGLGKEYSRRREHQVLRRKWVCLHVPVSLPACSWSTWQASVSEGKCGIRRGCPGRRKPDKVSCVCHGKEFRFYSTDACPLQEVPVSKTYRVGLTAHHPILLSVLLNDESWEQEWKAMGIFKYLWRKYKLLPSFGDQFTLSSKAENEHTQPQKFHSYIDKSQRNPVTQRDKNKLAHCNIVCNSKTTTKCPSSRRIGKLCCVMDWIFVSLQNPPIEI